MQEAVLKKRRCHQNFAVNRRSYANGRFALIRATSVLSTSAALLSRRFRFALLDESKCRRDECDRNTLPRPVILNRFATAFFVLRRAMGFGIGRER
jgi:hypothetical protein